MGEIKSYELIKVLGRSKVIEILKSLSRGEKTFTELQFDVRAQISTTQRAVNLLEERGLIQSKEAKKDGRRVVIYKLTPLGREVLRWLEEWDDRSKKLLVVR